MSQRRHPSEEDLIGYLYLDGEDPASVEAHLDACPTCRDEVATLRRVLDDVSEADRVPERPPDYPSRVWERVQRHLPARRGRPRFALLLAAAAAVLLATFLAGRFSGRSTPAGERTAGVRERVLLVALSDHIEESQVLLLDVSNSGGSEGSWTFDRDKAEELIRQSRLYRQTAHRLGDVATADVLEDLERLLLDVSHASDSEEARKSIQDRIHEQDMLFKLRVLDASVKSREQKLRNDTRRF